MPFSNPLITLANLGAGLGAPQQPFNDQPSLADLGRRRQQMLDERAAAESHPFIAPPNMDRNAHMPDDVATYRYLLSIGALPPNWDGS